LQVYELQGDLPNGKAHWTLDNRAQTGAANCMHIYFGPQKLWLLRSVFEPTQQPCSAYCSASVSDGDLSPHGAHLWHWCGGAGQR
jgi:hypothetical protein